MPNPQQLITESLNIWTAAIENKTTTGRGSNKKQHLYGIKKLRELILELAVRGLLVPQDPNDEPASVLLEKIAAEKAQLIKDGKIKKQKPLPEITDEEKPFDLPKGWEWVHLDNLSMINGGFAFKSSNYTESGTRVIRISDFDEYGFKEDRIVRYQFSDDLSPYLLKHNDILMAMTGGTVGKSYHVTKLKEEMLVNQRVATIRLIEDKLSEYIKLSMQSITIQKIIADAKNSTNDNISMGDIKGFLISMPPEAEQPRIVAKVDELMTLCDELEQQTESSLSVHQTLVESLLNSLLETAQSYPGHASSQNQKASDPFQQSWQRIWDNFDVLFTTESSIDQLKQTILQLAVMGKLVPQDDNDEPASILLEKIAAEKAQMIKDGKIKKQKPLPEITDEEKPFDLPKGWEWVRLQDITSKITDGDHKTPKRIDAGMRMLSAKNVRDGFLDFGNVDYISEPDYEKSRERCLPETGDLLIVSVGGTIGRSSLVPEDSDFSLVRSVALIKPLEFLPAYLKLTADSPLLQGSIHNNKRGGAQPCLYLSEISKFPFPLPPLKEQERIEENVRQLMSICDSLKERIQESQTTQLHLTDVMVKQALN